MGMTGGIVRGSPGQIQRLRDKPKELREFLDGNVWAPPVRAYRPRNFLLRWLLKISPITIEEVDPTASPPPDYKPPDEINICDLDKAWQGLHFLFTGTPWEGEEPACYLLRGGEELDELDEYSTVRVLSPDQVRAFATFLSALSRDELERRYDPHRMKELKIYPEIWTGKTGAAASALNYLLDVFDELRPFVSAAAAAGDAAVVYLA